MYGQWNCNRWSWLAHSLVWELGGEGFSVSRISFKYLKLSQSQKARVGKGRWWFVLHSHTSLSSRRLHCKEGRTKACGMYSSAFVPPGQILHRLLQRAQKADCILGRGVCVWGGPAARFLCRVWQSQARFAISPSTVRATNLQLTYCSGSRAYLFFGEYSS